MLMICENCEKEHDGSYKSGRFCSEKCRYAFPTKLKRIEINKAVSKKLKGSIPWHKGKTNVYSQEVLLKMSNSAKTYFENNPTEQSRRSTGRFCKPETREKISITGKGKIGGYREKGGRGIQGWYNGIYCNSSWELAYIIFCNDNNIKVERNKKGFLYTFNNEIHKFYPDFIVNNKYVEVKGYYDKRVESKISQFPYEIEVIDKNKINLYVDYATNKYGNFINLYENK